MTAKDNRRANERYRRGDETREDVAGVGKGKSFRMKRISLALSVFCLFASPALAQSYCEAKGVQTCSASLLYFAVWQPDFFIVNADQVKTDVGLAEPKVVSCLKAIENSSAKNVEDIAARVPADPSMTNTFQGQQLMTVDSLRRFSAIAQLAIANSASLPSNSNYQTQFEHVQKLRVMLHDPQTKEASAKELARMEAYEKAFLTNATQIMCK
jgi:hypothetical protein